MEREEDKVEGDKLFFLSLDALGFFFNDDGLWTDIFFEVCLIELLVFNLDVCFTFFFFSSFFFMFLLSFSLLLLSLVVLFVFKFLLLILLLLLDFVEYIPVYEVWLEKFFIPLAFSKLNFEVFEKIDDFDVKEDKEEVGIELIERLILVYKL